MTGIQAVIAEAFVSAIIKVVIKTASSYFSDKYKEQQAIKPMLDSLKASLPRIRSVLKLAEQKPKVENANLANWLQQLKDVIYEAEDVMDDFAAFEIHDSLRKQGQVSDTETSSARGIKNMFRLNSNEKKLKDLLKKINDVCDGIDDLPNLIEAESERTFGGSLCLTTGETSSFLSKTKKIFGRDKEIELILEMILTERQDQIKSVRKSDLSQRNITGINLMENASNLLANTSTKVNVNFNEKRKQNAESSESFGVTQDKVNPIGQKFSSSQNIISPIRDALSGDDQFRVTDNISTSPVCKKPKLSISLGDPIIKVLPIVGISGIGKTTIAQVIYNHSKVREHFDLQGWVYVTDSPGPEKLLHDILCSFDVESNKSIAPIIITNLSEGHTRLKWAIEHKRFLLIFDNVREGMNWINSTWKDLIELLAEGALGSTIMVTTDSNSVATSIGTLPSLSLDYLPQKQFLGLFEYYAFGHNMIKYNDNYSFPLTQHQETVLKPIGENIAKKLHGLPLAAVVIGNLLSAKKEPNYWYEILESAWWNLPVSKQIIIPFSVVFQNLDPDLKQCFIYCSLFPRNYVFDKDRLVQMWIAHGFIDPTNEEQFRLESEEIQMEDIGRSKFDKLVDRFFFQNTILNNKYVMNDLIRELAIAISSELLYVSGNRMKVKNTFPSCVRHLAIDPKKDDDVYVDHMKWSEENKKRLRTIMFFGFCKMSEDKAINCILDQLVGLRLLDLSYFRSQFFVLDKCKLSSHLRFLDLSFSKIEEIPESLCELVHLQVLDVRGCSFSHLLPAKINRLFNLRLLYTDPGVISRVRGIGRLTKLQELKEFRVREEEGFTISELTDLKSLNGQLTLKDLENVPSNENAISVKLEEKKYLTSLIFDMAEFRMASPQASTSSSSSKHRVHHKEILEELKSHKIIRDVHREHHQKILEGLKPHKNIRKLSIARFFSATFPSWMMNIHELSSLTTIQLNHCYQLEILPPLGSLPSLEVLNLYELESITCIGNEFYGTSDVIFPSLRELAFSLMHDWEIWSDPGERKCFPCLRKLNIVCCNKLSEMPLHFLDSMVELHLFECDMVTKNVGKHVATMTSLTQLYLGGDEDLKLDLCCDHLRELRYMSLTKISITQHEGPIIHLVSLKKLRLCLYRQESHDRQNPPGALQEQHMHSLPSLACIELIRCNRIPEVLFTLGRFPSLRSLYIDRYDEDEFTSFEDSWLQRLSSLEDLELSRCYRLKHLPPSLSTLSSLKKLSLKGCTKIHSLPEQGLPRSLMELHMIKCSAELMQGCQPNTGAEWSKISHIPCIRVKGRPYW